MSVLTGRYQLKSGILGRLFLLVEECREGRRFKWRRATIRDIKDLEPEVRDGWRYREERDGHLDPRDGKRFST